MSKAAFDIRVARGQVLRGLAPFYPNAISGGLIYRDMLQPAFTMMEWIEAFRVLEYLRERGLLEVVTSGLRSDAAKDKLYRLTPAGLDVASGVTTDAAIETEL